MKQKLINILSNMKRYNASNLAELTFGLDTNVEYDALVVAPAWKPTKIIEDPSFTTIVLTEHSYISSYLVEKDGLKIAWIQTASGGGNLLDHLLICGELKFKKLIFIGAVGALKDPLPLCTENTPLTVRQIAQSRRCLFLLFLIYGGYQAGILAKIRL